ncbi:MAG: hypothetical protein GXP49_12330 [Deltaproteobacteria bacterium]|nr:hypothetical protein [Deltaproteobacteria bacterium]
MYYSLSRSGKRRALDLYSARSRVIKGIFLLLLVANGCGSDTGSMAYVPDQQGGRKEPCKDNPCKNGGTCIPDGDSYNCKCPEDTGWTGKHCDTCAEGWNDSCTSCLERHTLVHGQCLPWCDPEHLNGYCPESTSCDGNLGYCRPIDPELHCKTYWDAKDGQGEPLVCGLLHNSTFLAERTGNGLDKETFIGRFKEVWNLVHDWYGAFDAAECNWDEVHDRYLARANTSGSLYEQAATISNMFAELEDAHTQYFCTALDQKGMLLNTLGTFFPFLLKEVDGELVVYASFKNDIRVGDRVVSINGLSGDDLLTYWRERLKDYQGFSSESNEMASFVASVANLAADPLLVGTKYEPLLSMVIEHQNGDRYVLLPDDASKDVNIWVPNWYTYYSDDPLVHLEWTPYSRGDWGNGSTGYIGHGWLGNIAIWVFQDFTGDDELELAMREVASMYDKASGYLVDVRNNAGGGPHQETLTSFFIEKPVFNPHVDLRVVGEDRFEPCDECVEEIMPDDQINLNAPVAVLVNGLTASAGDFFAYEIAQASKSRLFGSPTCGAFGNMSMHYGDGYVASITWTRVTDRKGNLLQGHSVSPDKEIKVDLTDIEQYRDTVFEEAIKWLKEQGDRQPPIPGDR